MIATAVTAEQVAELVTIHLAASQATPWGTTLQHLALWSPGILILVGLFLLLRRPPKIVEDLVEAQQAQARAMGHMATAISVLPQQRDLKFDEVLIGQQMILVQLDRIDSNCRQRLCEQRVEKETPS